MIQTTVVFNSISRLRDLLILICLLIKDRPAWKPWNWIPPFAKKCECKFEFSGVHLSVLILDLNNFKGCENLAAFCLCISCFALCLQAIKLK